MPLPQMMNEQQWVNQNGGVNPDNDSYNPAAYNNYASQFQGGGQPFMDAYSQGGQLPGGGGYVAPNFSDMEGAGLYGMNQAASLYGQGGINQEFGQDTLNAQGMIRNMAGGQNPVSGAIGATQGIQDASNPFMQGLSNQSVNPYTDQMANFGTQQNEQLGNMFDIGSNKIQDQMNSMFGLAGRGQSGAHAKLTGEALGNFGTNLYGGAFDAMQNRNLSGLNSASNAFDNGMNRNLSANQAGAGLQLNAAGMMPGLNTAQYGNAAMLGSMGGDIDAQNNFNANSGWNNLQNYSNTMAQLQGTQPPDRPESSNFDKMLGLGMTGASLYSAFSSKDYKENKKPVNTLNKLNSLPIERWDYKNGISDGGGHIGAYAEDFTEAFNVGDGKTINLVDAVGVTMRAVQELSAQVKKLESNQ